MGIERTLHLYGGQTGRGGYSDRKVPMDTSKCPVQRGSNEGRAGVYHEQCDRKVKPGATAPVFDYRAGTAAVMPVCGVHLGVYNQAAKKDREEQTKRDSFADGMKEMEAVASAISDLTGLEVSADSIVDRKLYRMRATGRVKVDGKALLDWLTKEATR